MKRFPIQWRHVMIVLGLIVLIVLIMDFNRRMDEYNRLARQRETVRAEGTAVMQTQVALITQVAYATSDAAVEEWAYVEGRWVREGEKPVVVLPAEEASPTPAPAAAPASEAIPNWRIWWELFFGDH